MANVLTDSRHLDWDKAKVSAQRIIRVCDDAGFSAPEDLVAFQSKLHEVADHLNAIAAALRMIGKSESP